jgi:hypothetical protein
MNTIAQVPRSQNDDSTAHASTCHGFAGKARLSLMLAALSAALATAVSLGIATYAGWQRGGAMVEQLMNVALGGVAVLYVHLLPMRWSVLRALPLAVAFALWCVGLLVVLYGQVTFFMVSQQHAGSQRAATVPTTVMRSSMYIPLDRTPTEIAWDAAKVSADLARVEARRCVVDCPALKAREAILAAQLAALNTEAGEARRREAEEDRRDQQGDRNEALRATLRTDPVASTVASWVGTTEARLELILGIACATVLEGAAVIGWLLVSVTSERAGGHSTAVCDWRAIAPDGAGSRESVVPECEAVVGEHETIAPEPSIGTTEPAAWGDDRTTCVVSDQSVDGRLVQLIRDVADGAVQPTVAGIRSHLGCAQETAAKLRRELLALGVVTVHSNGGRYVHK